MPSIKIKIEGRGKMIKTILLNLDDIAIALERPPDYLLKFFGLTFGSTVDSKNKKYTISGEKKVDELNKVLDTFIEKYILCSKCNNPETNFSVGNKNNLILMCRACGGDTMVDFDHKMTAYILKKEITKEKATKNLPKTTDQDDDDIKTFLETNNNLTLEQIRDHVERVKTKSNWSSDITLRSMFSVLFNENYSADLDKKTDILQLFVIGPDEQKTTLYCLDKLATLGKEQLSLSSSLLIQFSQKGICSTELIKEWYQKPNPKINKTVATQLRETLQDFVENL